MCEKGEYLKRLFNHHWGADRRVLLQLYLAILRSMTDYGSIFYMIASKTRLKRLNIIQNTCLRIMIGARKTSPVLSLEAESNVPPLYIHRIILLIKYYFRLCEMPRSLPVTDELFSRNYKTYYRAWSSTVRVPPLIVRSWRYLLSCQFPHAEPVHTNLISPVPPWINRKISTSRIYDSLGQESE